MAAAKNAVQRNSTNLSGVDDLLAMEKGSATAVAERLTTEGAEPCSRQLVEYWVSRGYVTGTWAPLVRKIYGIPLHKLNPKIYPADAA